MVQQQQLHLPAARDPVARLALFALGSAALWLAVVAPSVPAQAEAQAQVLATPAPIIVIATPTAGIVEPTAAPLVELTAPTAAPPTEPPPAAEPQVVEVVVEVPPVPTEPPPPEPTTPPVTALPAGSIVILPTATMTRDEFVASFGPTPDPNAKCAFVGCLPKP